MTSVGVGAPDRESQVDAGRRGWRRSKWIGFTFVPLGLLSWMAFLYAGIGARMRRWQAWGGFYFAVAIAAWVLLSAAGRAPRGHHSHDAVAGGGFLLLLAVWIGSIIHAFAIRRRYLELTQVSAHPEAFAGEEDVVLRWSAAKLFLLFVFCGAIVLVSLLAIATDPAARASLWPWFCVVFFAGLGSVLARQVHRRRGGLVVGRGGIGMPGWRIPWREITKITHYEQVAGASTQHYLNVYTRDGYDFPPARKWLVRLLKPLNDRFTRGATTSIPLSLLPASPDDVIALVRRFYDGPIE